MTELNVRQIRENISKVLDNVIAGDEVIVMRRGKAVARLTGIQEGNPGFVDRSELRQSLPPMKEDAAQSIRSLRENERY